MDDSAGRTGQPASPPYQVSVFDHLSGAHRGTRQVLAGERVRVGTAGDVTVHFPETARAPVAPHHASLSRQGPDWVLTAEPFQRVEVNGNAVETRTLAAGDIVRFGANGPLVRFRRLGNRNKVHKSMGQVLGDCVDCSRLESTTRLGRAAVFLKTAPVALLTQPAPWLRAALLLSVVVLLALTAQMVTRLAQLERQVTNQTAAMDDLQQLLDRADETTLTLDELQTIRGDVESRLDELEARNTAGPRVIAAAAASVVFVQGSYGFNDPNGRPLRVVLGPDGRPARGPRGMPFISADADGPLLERQFTGTAFVASEDDLLLTNRHIALPWEADPSAEALVRQGLEPRLHRLIGYLPGVAEPFDMQVVAASDTADVALLRCNGVTASTVPLQLSSEPVTPGEEVFVLGYPAGIDALLARSDEAFVDALMDDSEVDFWEVARRLSNAGHMNPLATRGIVGQVNAARVVYDAGTTSGGSGGPVLGLDGTVQAINSAVLVDFDGSNLGVPADEARRLLAQAAGG